MLQNKKGLWKSAMKWKFTSKGDLIRIENIQKKKVWGTTNDSTVKLENSEDDNDGQLWKKGKPNNKGYFTLENCKAKKFLTPVSSTSLELKGNITLRWIPLTS
jgi:hypothetical protein